MDDFGYDNRGLFYLGENNKLEIAIAVKQLVSKLVSRYNIDHSIYIGSSKGGYAALYFGLDDPESTIIVGAPQYYLRYYLNDAKDNRRLAQICGEKVEDIGKADYIIKRKIDDNKFTGKIYLHYSSQEHTFEEHIVDLIEDIERVGIKLETDEQEYKNHSDVAIYFPDYLLKSLNNILA
ncbi:TPA: hypothetical protein ACGXMW_001677 [Bacillus paranthracis]